MMNLINGMQIAHYYLQLILTIALLSAPLVSLIYAVIYQGGTRNATHEK